MGQNLQYACRRDGAVPGTCPSASLAMELMANQLRAALVDAEGNANAVSDLLGELLASTEQKGKVSGLEDIAMKMVDHLQFFDLLNQRVSHIANVLDAIAGADGLPGEMLPSFDVLVALLKQQYSCGQEQALHQHFLMTRTSGCRLADDDIETLIFDAK